MLLTPDTPSPASPLARHDSVFALLLLLTLLLAASTFFAAFALAAIVAGLLLGVLLHHSSGERADHSTRPDRLIGINFASIHVGGDAGGLIFVLGSVAILAMGIPMLRWFLLASLLVAAIVAFSRMAWHDRHWRPAKP